MASLPSDQDYVYTPSIVIHHNILSIAFETFVYGTTRVFLFPRRVPRGTYLTAFQPYPHRPIRRALPRLCLAFNVSPQRRCSHTASNVLTPFPHSQSNQSSNHNPTIKNLHHHPDHPPLHLLHRPLGHLLSLDNAFLRLGTLSSKSPRKLTWCDYVLRRS